MDGSKSSVISIHALLAESDHDTSSLMQCQVKFLSTLSLRRATREPTAFRTPHQRFLSTLSLRRATAAIGNPTLEIAYFYPRSPCGERLFQLDVMITTFYYFYPRSPCGERHFRTLRVYYRSHFYPRSPCGERRLLHGSESKGIKISIHALLAESD